MKKPSLAALMSQMNTGEPVETVERDEKKESRKELNQKTRKEPRAPRLTVAPSPSAEESSELERVSFNLPRNVRELLLDESLRRKKGKAEQWAQQEILAEAVVSYLGGK